MSLKIHGIIKRQWKARPEENGELKIQQEVEAILNRLPRAAGGEEQSFPGTKRRKQRQQNPTA